MPERYVTHRPEAYGYRPVRLIHSNLIYIKNNKKYNLLGRYSIDAVPSEKCLLIIKTILLLLVSWGTAILSSTVRENLMGRKVTTFYLQKNAPNETNWRVHKLHLQTGAFTPAKEAHKPPLNKENQALFDIVKFASQKKIDQWFDICRKKYDLESLFKFLYVAGEDTLPTQALPFVSGDVYLDELDNPSELPQNRDWSQVRYLYLTCHDEEGAISPELVSHVFTQCPHLEHLTLAKCGLDDEARLIEVSQILKEEGQNLKTLSLESNLLKDADTRNPAQFSQGYLSLQEAVRSMPLLEKLDLSDNDLSLNEQDFTAWIGPSSVDRTVILRDNPQLNEPSGDHDFLGSHFDEVIEICSKMPSKNKSYVSEEGPCLKLVKDNVLAINIFSPKGLNSENLTRFCNLNLVLTGLSISRSDLNDEHLKTCIEQWKAYRPTSLKRLTLEGNNITDEGARALAQFLESNQEDMPSLEEIELKDNAITEKGQDALRTALCNAEWDVAIDILASDEKEKD